MVRQCLILFGCLAAGELIVWATGLALPASIIGMLLLTLSLELKLIKPEWIEGLSDFLVENLGFFFVPAGVAIMKYYGLLVGEFLPIVVATVVSTLLVLVCTGRIHQWFDGHGLSRR